MAARRLVVVMLVLLAISTLAAALLPPPERQNPAGPERPRKKGKAPQAAPRPSDAGLLLVARLRISERLPKTVRIERGDELRLQVAAPFGAVIEIPGLGLTSPVTPFAAARFDILATAIGTFAVRVVETGQPAGKLLVGRPDSGRCGVSRPAAPQGRGSTPSCALRDERGSRGRGRSARRP